MSNKYVSNTILYSVPAVFLVLILLRIFYSYSDIKETEYEFAKKEAEVLSSYVRTHNNYYQKLFIDKILEVNAKTLPALPAYSSLPISKSFSKNNILHITARSVSNRARNPKNQADNSEMIAIESFNKSPKQIEYFSDSDNEFYHYAYALRIEQKCLACHSQKEKAPLFIQQTYDKAYDYKIGELRGIVSIKIPKKELDIYFMSFFYSSIVYDIALLSILFLFISYLMRKFENINLFLHKEVANKTYALTQSKYDLEELLIRDRLTEQFNRVKLIDDIAQADTNKPTHLALINIDSFKDINDFYGHQVADEVLKEIADMLYELSLRSNSTIYKLPSDEYAIFNTDQEKSELFAKQVKHKLSTLSSSYIEIDNHHIYLSFSCGIASNVTPILIKADIALQRSKSSKDSLIIYDKSLSTTDTIKKNLDILTQLKIAIKKDTITPYFQPIYNLETQKIEKYESLARVVTEDGNILTPYYFMDISIKSKQYHHITRAMIRKSFEFFKDKEYEFSLNISMDDITNPITVEFILEILEDKTLAKRAVFEILETQEIMDYNLLKSFIKKIKKRGARVAIDDFGSGYSNFAHILELNVDYLKIDASLVKNITTDKNSKAITQTIIDFAHNLDMKTIAEFVEDEESLNMLKEMGSDYAQGYYIGKPSINL